MGNIIEKYNINGIYLLGVNGNQRVIGKINGEEISHYLGGKLIGFVEEKEGIENTDEETCEKVRKLLVGIVLEESKKISFLSYAFGKIDENSLLYVVQKPEELNGGIAGSYQGYWESLGNINFIERPGSGYLWGYEKLKNVFFNDDVINFVLERGKENNKQVSVTFSK